MLTNAIIISVLSAAAYTLGVWTLSKNKKLKALQLLLFWLAFCGNAAGAGLLRLAVGEGSGFLFRLRSVCIIISVVILFVHAVWATALMSIPEDKSMRIFLRDSKLVWKIWLIFFLPGVILGLF